MKCVTIPLFLLVAVLGVAVIAIVAFPPGYLPGASGSSLRLLDVAATAQTKAIKIGMVKTFVAFRPKSMVAIATDEFKDVMKKTTGLTGDIRTEDSPFKVAEELENKQLDFGIFHGHEFAWVKEKHKDLQPILIVASRGQVERAILVVNLKSEAKSIADMRGKPLDIAMDASERCRRFLDKICHEADKKESSKYFGSTKNSKTQNDALDDVARGNSQATVVDAHSLAFYKDVKGPVFDKHLKVLLQSEPFPPSVIVYRKGGVDEATLKQFSEGMLKAHTIPEGRELMKAWAIKAFEPIPKDYNESLAGILKAYPSPALSP